MKGTTIMARSQRPAKPTSIITEIGVGDAINTYEIQERIGQDELATIYRAHHQTLERDVWLHILRKNNWLAINRFQLAAKLGARIQHPHILPVLDAGHHERYGHYMTTPPVVAQPLQTLLDGGPLDLPLAIRVFTHIGQAVDELHRQDVVHRDIQPQTILVDDNGSAFLTGFTLAWTPNGPDLSQLSEADYLTPYAAPEQTLDQTPPHPSVDVYALGAVLYHMLTGEAPQDTDPMPLSTYDPALAPADRVMQRMLAPQPQLRYATAAQAGAALRSVLRPLDPHALPDELDDQAAQWLENPLEVAPRDRLDASFLERTRERAERLHNGDGVRHLLDLWSNDNPVRRQQMGHLIQIEQTVSYNAYFYDLAVLYETRTEPERRRQPLVSTLPKTEEPEPDRWQVAVPVPVDPFEAVPATEIVVPHSERSLVCPTCSGEGQIRCSNCEGEGTLEIKRTIKSGGRTQVEVQTVDCPDCQGEANTVCDDCDGAGRLVEQSVFQFSRRARLWQNTDDIEGLSQRVLEQRSEAIFQGEIDPHDPAWHSVPALQELLAEATADLDDDTHIMVCELTIRGVPVTEVDYSYRDKPRTLAIVGFDEKVRGDLSLVDTERILLIALAVALLIALGILAFVALR
jgi:serine/threonine protein kinase